MAKRLYRSRKNRLFCGVAAGLAEYFDIDVVIIRVAFVLAIFCGFGIIAYIVLLIAIPEELPFKLEHEEVEEMAEKDEKSEDFYSKMMLEHERRRSYHRSIFAVVLIAIGCLWLLGNFIPQIHFHNIWPIGLIILGLLILFRPSRNNRIKEVK